MDLSRYIQPQNQMFLESVNYQILELTSGSGNKLLTVMDAVSACFINDKQVKIVFGRKLTFNPSGLFELSVSFGAIYTLKDEFLNEWEWSSFDLSKEVSENSPSLLNPLVARTSMLISEITASFGQNPIVTPPTFQRKRQN